jgi:acetyl esterase/lipase
MVHMPHLTPIWIVRKGASSASLSRLSREVSIAILVLCLACIPFAHQSAMAQGQAAAPAHRDESFHNFRLTKFYDSPDPLPAGKPGGLIRAAEFDGYNLPLGVSAVRLLYHSRSANNDDVAVSGVALIPDGKPPAGGWPVIAWAHELRGVARVCAPSLARNLPHGPFLSMYVQLGYAVVTTDYAGLGTNFRNAFADMSSNSLDVIYSIPAARSALPQLGPKWIAMGTGEGGSAVVAVAETEHQLQDPNYLGSITLSPLADLQDIYESLSHLSYKSPLFLTYGIKTVFPQFDVTDVLTDKAIPLYQQIGNTCGETEASAEDSAAGMLKPSWKINDVVQSYFSRNRLGLKPAKAPLLVVGSGNDPSIAETTKIVDRLCKQGDQVQFQKYPEYDPGRVIGDSVRDQITWIQARFANRPARSNCSPQP